MGHHRPGSSFPLLTVLQHFCYFSAREREARNCDIAQKAASLVLGYGSRHSPRELGASVGTGGGECLSRSRPRCRNVQGLARLCPAEQEAGMWQGGSGQVIKELKCYLPAEPSCRSPAAWGAELSGLALPGLPGT